MSKIVLVTGATGYIGSHTIIELQEAGYEVLGIDNLVNSSEFVLDRIFQITQKKPLFLEGDLRNKDFLQSLFSEFDISSVIHFAGYKAVGESVEFPMLYFSNNLTGSQVLLETMADYGIKNLVFSSSCTVYGNPTEVPITEDSKLSPANPYGRTKYWIEQMLMDISEADSRWSIISLRYFNPIGAHQSGLIGEDPTGIPNNLVPYITQIAVGKRKVLSIFGDDYDTPDGTCIRDYIHVVDLAKGHIKALEKLDANLGYQAVNLGTGRGYSVLEVVEAFEKVNAVDIPYKIAPRRPGDAEKVWADTQKAKEILNWEAGLDLQTMLADSWNWQQKNPAGYSSK